MATIGTSAVRRQSYWDRERRRLRESLARLVDDATRLLGDAASVVIGSYNDFAPASWLYAANIMLSALAMLRVSMLKEEEADRPTDDQGRFAGAILFVSAALSVALSFYVPRCAMVACALYIIPSMLRRRCNRTVSRNLNASSCNGTFRPTSC